MTRIIAIDNMRGIAFIFMIIQHLFYFYDVSNLYETDLASNFFVSSSGTIARSLFIFLAGCSLVLNYKNDKEKFKKNRFKRSFEILMHALLVSAVSYIYYPNYFIRFGILHFISLATFLSSFLVPHVKLYLISIMFFLFIKPPRLNIPFDIISGASAHFNMMDWFPLFKWLPLMIIGMYSMNNVDVNKLKLIDIDILKSENVLTYLGKNSLNLYTFHLIFLIIFFYYMKNKRIMP